jgi:transposase
MIAAYREPDRARGQKLMAKLIESVGHSVPGALSELVTLGRTLKKRADAVLAYFDRPGTRVEGRSKQAFKQWLADRPTTWRQGVEVVAMDGFTGFKTATTEELPDAVAVTDPFHVVRLAGDALDRCRRRVQQDTHGHRGRKDDPLYRARRTLHTGADFLTDKQKESGPRVGRGDPVLLLVSERRADHVPVASSWPRLRRAVTTARCAARYASGARSSIPSSRMNAFSDAAIDSPWRR